MENVDVKTDGATPSVVAETSNAAVLTSEQKAAWNGGKETKPEQQDSAPAKESKPEGQPESAAEAGAAKDHSQDKGSKRKLSAEERIQQLEATIEKIRKESGKAPAAKEAESATAKPEPTKVEPPKALEAPKKPKIEDFTGPDAWEKFEAAKEDYYDKLAEYKAKLAVEQDRQQRQMEAAQREFNKYLAEAVERYPTLKEVLPPFTKELESAHPYVQAMLNSTDNVADVLMVICGDEAQKAEFLNEAKGNPAKAIKRVAVIEAEVRAELSKAKETPKEAKEPEKKDKPAEPVTRAPKPISEVGGRGTATEDSGIAAARSGDFRTAKAEWNREFLAANK